MKRWIWYGALFVAAIFYRTTWVLLTPFLLALLIAAILNPAVSWIERKTPFGRTMSTVFVFGLAGLLGSGILLLATAALVQAIVAFIDLLPKYRDIFTVWSQDLISRVGELYLRIPPDVIAVAKRHIDQVITTGQHLLTLLGQSVLVALGSLPGLGALLLIGLLAGFFLTKDWALFVDAFRRLLPDEWRHSVDRAGSEVGNSLGRYILAQGIVITISTLVSMLGLLLIGVDRWLAAGLVGGVLDLMPIFGPALFYVPWAIYAWVVGQKAFAIWLLALYGGVSLLRQFTEPKIVGETLGIHPLVMMAGLYWGGVLFGAKGIIIAPLVIIIAKAWLKVHQDGVVARR